MKVIQCIKNSKWWRAASNRAVRTLAQTLIASIGTAAVISAVDWRYAISASVLAAILSLLTSLTGLPEVDDNDNSETIEA